MRFVVEFANKKVSSMSRIPICSLKTAYFLTLVSFSYAFLLVITQLQVVYTIVIIVRIYVNLVKNICHLELAHHLTKHTLLVIW